MREFKQDMPHSRLLSQPMAQRAEDEEVQEHTQVNLQVTAKHLIHVYSALNMVINWRSLFLAGL